MINKKIRKYKKLSKPRLFSLVLNEATGLDDSYLNVGTSVMIPQTADDSLNLTIAVGIVRVYTINRLVQGVQEAKTSVVCYQKI